MNAFSIRVFFVARFLWRFFAAFIGLGLIVVLLRLIDLGEGTDEVADGFKAHDLVRRRLSLDAVRVARQHTLSEGFPGSRSR